MSHGVTACVSLCFFFFNDTATTEIYTLSLHDALPIWCGPSRPQAPEPLPHRRRHLESRSEEHTSELQSLAYLVCRLLLEKKTNRVLQRGSLTRDPWLVSCVTNFAVD